jgi:hypothetical protein
LLKKYEHFSNTFISSEANEKDKRDRQLKAASPNNKREKWRKKNARTISTWLSGCRMFKKTSPTPRRRVSQSQNENVWQEVALKRVLERKIRQHQLYEWKSKIETSTLSLNEAAFRIFSLTAVISQLSLFFG